MDRYLAQKLTETVFLYLNGERVSLVQGTIVALSTESEEDAEKLYKKIPVTSDLEAQLFRLLRVPPNQHKFYVNKPHLFSLLAHLHQDGYGSGHLGYLLSLISETKYYFYRRLNRMGFIAFLISGVGIFLRLKPEQAARLSQFIVNRLPTILLDWFQKTFSLLKNLTFIGALYSLGRYVMFLYDTFYHGFSNLSQKLTALSFRTLATSLNLAAYGIIFWASGVATPLSGFLFIAASFMSAVESLAHYIVIRYRPVAKDNHIEDAWLKRADEIREENQQQFATKEMFIRVFFALLVTAIVTAWCLFAPQSILLTIGFMAALMVAGQIESLIFSKLEARNASHLQTQLQAENEVHSSNRAQMASAQKIGLTNAPADVTRAKSEKQPAVGRFFQPAQQNDRTSEPTACANLSTGL